MCFKFIQKIQAPKEQGISILRCLGELMTIETKLTGIKLQDVK